MEDYKSNSHKSKEVAKVPAERKKLDKVVSGDVKVKKKSGVHKFTDVFISEDVSNVKTYILMDVLVPAIKKAVSDIVTNGIDMILYGGNGGSKKRSTNGSYISYNNYSDRRRESHSYGTTTTRSGYSYDEISIPSRGEAEEVLTRMDELIETYGIVSVADFYDLVGITGEYTDNKYGWTNIRSAEVVRVRDGYVIKLPKALPLN